jgi:hypothetical protein
MKKILYWDKFFYALQNNQEINNNKDLEKLVKKLLNGQLKDAGLEKIKSGKLSQDINLYSARLNKADRALFTTINHGNSKCLLFIY